MKDLIQYRYACTDFIFKYMQGNCTEKELIFKLRNLEEYHQNTINEEDMNKGFWFNFFKGDSLATTINDIANILALPKTHTNYQSLIQSFQIAIDDGSLKVYYS